MHPLVADITGLRSGMLVAVSYLGKSVWLCQCDCGNAVPIKATYLKTGSRTQCGCKRRCGVTWEPVVQPDGCLGIPLLKGRFAIVDAADFPIVKDYNWGSVTRRANLWHAYTQSRQINKSKRRAIFMHRLIMNAEKGQQIDHKDGDGLNNRRSNLRFCTTQQNAFNKKAMGGKSRFKGVSMNRHGTWTAAISIDKKPTYIGTYLTEEEAARAYDDNAVEIQGEFARFNLPRE